MATEGKLRAIVLAVILRPADKALLVQRGFDPAKAQVYCRPLGGGIEFGELSQDALRREMLEELSAAVRPVRNLGTLENVFVYNGAQCHELVIMWLAEFDDPTHYLEETLPYREGEQLSVAQWEQPSALKAQGIPLYPTGLTELLQHV